ncbi:hypothetical protein CPB84DRAFT_167146 [Gymnopilus junonius]|uniref:F-box domain-containing protein n=1 Tax=Gymnopilus junonius TaxID=109634 RepID=A0A9P5NXF2_GYMJU|nr:hypothetical protein CPB84DRAFT_167146 [Gymnopilus junonius]
MNGRGHSGMCHNRTNDGKSCQSCIELERIEAQIVETQEALDRLHAKHLEIQTKANHSHDSLMRRLPPEIVANVFQLYLPTLPADNNLRNMGVYAMKPPLILGAVCRAWRQITLTTPQLWNFVKMKLTYTYDLRGRCDYAQKRLARSGELPITICLDIEPAIYAFDTVHDLLDAIIQCSDRWHVLDLRCHSSAFFHIANQVRATPILHTLRLRVADVPLISQCSLRISDATPEIIDLHGAMLINAIDANWIRHHIWSVAHFPALSRLTTNIFPFLLQSLSTTEYRSSSLKVSIVIHQGYL